MSDPANAVEPATRSLIVVAAWRPPEASEPVVGMCDQVMTVAEGERVMLTISDVSADVGPQAPCVVALGIKAMPGGFVVRDVTHAIDGLASPCNETERLEDDERRQRGLPPLPPPWWCHPLLGVAMLLAGLAAGCFVAAAMSGGAIHAVFAATGAVASGLACGAVTEGRRATADLNARRKP